MAVPQEHKDTHHLSPLNAQQVIEIFNESSTSGLVLSGVVIILAFVIYKRRDDIKLTNSSIIAFLILLMLLKFLYEKFNSYQYKSTMINFNPPVKNDNYIPRKSSKKLYSRLNDSSQILPIIFHGQGGAGKTEMMLNYIHSYHKGDAYWFNSENPTIIREYLHIFLINKGCLKYDQAADEDISVAFNTWRKSFPHDLCIFDNLIFSDQIRKWLTYPDKINPPAQAKVICIVSSDSDYFSENGFSVIAIEEMLPEESQKLLEKYSGIACENELNQANQLIAELDNLPLVIVAAGSYIKQNNYSYRAFLEFFQQNKITVLQQRPNERHVSAWVMFYAHFNKLNENQKILLQYACCLSQNNISRSLLRDIVQRPVKEVNENLLTLQKKGLLQPDDKNHFKMHAIFRHLLQSNIIENKEPYLIFLSRIYKVLDEALSRGNIQLFLPHVHSLADLTNRGVIFSPSKEAIKIFNNFFYLYSMANHHSFTQEKKNTYSIFSGVNIAMRGVKSGGIARKLVSKNVICLSKIFFDDKKMPFSKDSYRANVAIAFLKLSTAEKISTYLLYKEIDDSIEPELISELSNQQLNLFKAYYLLFRIHILPLPGAEEYFKEQAHHIYTTTKEELERYKENLITDCGFFEKDEEIIIINAFLAMVYREVAIRLDSEDEVIYELKNSMALFEKVISDMKSCNVSDDYILLVEIKLELATAWKKLLVILNKQISENQSIENLTYYEEIEKSYNSAFTYNLNCLKSALPKNSDIITKFNVIYSDKLPLLDSVRSINKIELSRNGFLSPPHLLPINEHDANNELVSEIKKR